MFIFRHRILSEVWQPATTANITSGRTVNLLPWPIHPFTQNYAARYHVIHVSVFTFVRNKKARYEIIVGLQLVLLVTFIGCHGNRNL